MILSKIKQYLLREIKWISLLNHYKIVWFKKIFIFISSFFVISFLIWDITFAADATTTTAADAAATFAQRFWEILKWVSVLLWLMTYLATLFLSPEWINGSLFWMSTKFKEVWIMVSNIVYFVFAFILIWIAFMNIIGKNANQYQLKQALPKFIVWVIIVPFSWFFVQLILSISSLLTVSALTLPSNSFPEYESILWQITIPTECVINVKSIWKWSWEWEWKTTDLVDCSHSVKKPLSTVVSWWNINNSIFWIISMYTYGLTGFENSDNIFLSESSKFTSIADVAIKIIFDWLFIIIYAILMIALWMVLMIRWIYIWIYTMMSPIFWLMYFFDKKDWGDWFFAKFNIKEFIALAMVPVYTMLALSFGLLFMYVVWEWITWWARQWEISGQSVTVKTVDDWWTISIWLFTLKIVWAVSWSNDDNFWFLKKIWNEWLWVVWSLILKLFGIVVLWWTVMAAMRSSDITKAIVEPLHQFGTKVWGIMTSAPWNMPIFGGQSMKSMWNIANAAEQSVTKMNTDRSQSFLDKHHLFWWSNSSKEFRELESSIKSTNWDANRQVAAMHKIFHAADWNTKLLYTDPEAQKRLFELAQQMKIKLPDSIKKSTDINSSSQLEKLMNAIESSNPAMFKNVIWSASGWNIRITDIESEVIKRKTSTWSSPNWNIWKPVLNQQWVNDVIDFNWSKPKVETSDWKVTKLLWAVDDLARYIAQNNLNTESLNELITSLNLSDSAVKELKVYFKEDKWKIVYDSTWKWWVDVRKFAKEHDTNDDDISN